MRHWPWRRVGLQGGVLARRDGGLSAARSNRFVAFARATSPQDNDRSDVLTGRDLIEQLGQHGGITGIAGDDFDRTNFQRFLVNSDVCLAQVALFGTAMFAGVPLVNWQEHAAARGPRP